MNSGGIEAVGWTKRRKRFTKPARPNRRDVPAEWRTLCEHAGTRRRFMLVVDGVFFALFGPAYSLQILGIFQARFGFFVNTPRRHRSHTAAECQFEYTFLSK